MSKNSTREALRQMAETLHKLMKEKEGSPEEHEHEVNKCELCDDLGVVITEDEARMVACPTCEKGRQLRQEQRRKRYEKTKMPVAYQDALLDNWVSTGESLKGKYLAFAACCTYAARDGRMTTNQVIETLEGIVSPIPARIKEQASDRELCGIVLWGDYGVGKTWLAAATANQMMLEDYREILYIRMKNLIQRLTDTWKGEERTQNTLDIFRSVSHLFVDDMNAEPKQATFKRDYAAEISRQRMNNFLPTLITTNHSPEEFSKVWGEEAAEPLIERLMWVQVGGEKLRQRNTWGSL